jgi:glycosyltransferase involved in cell wall biosynthesis
MNDVRQLKVLASAHAFSPIRGSEFAIGWDYVRAISSQHKVWVLTKSTEKEEIEQYLHRHPDMMPNVTVHYVSWVHRSIPFPLELVTTYFRHRYWHWRAYRLAHALDAQIDFDLVHQITCTGYREPGYLWKLGKPFVWGPIGGLTFFPLKFLDAVPLSWRPFFLLKNLSVAWSMYVARRPRRAIAAATAIFAATSNVARRLLSLCGRDAPISCEVSAPDLGARQPTRRAPGEALRIVWSGTCEPRKALNIVLLALEQLKRSSVDWRLIVVGGGPLLAAWKALASNFGLAERCSFLGTISRAEVLSVMESGHCFVQPSLYDATTSVLVEALALGLPVICLDHMGFSDVVNQECGIKIELKTLSQVIREFAEAFEFIERDEDRRFRMAIAAQKTAQQLTWKQKAVFINELYSQVLPAVSTGSESANSETEGLLLRSRQ